MLRQRTTRSAVATAMTSAAIVALLLATSSPAVALDTRASRTTEAPPSPLVCSVGTRVTVCFEPYGDHFWIKDKKADGHHVGAQWDMEGEGGRDHVCHDYYGKAEGWTICKGLSDNIPEGENVFFRAGVYEGDEPYFDGGGWGPLESSATT